MCLNRLDTNVSLCQDSLGHLKLILWCYNAIFALYDQTFKQEENIFDQTIAQFSLEEQEFYYICKGFVSIQTRDQNAAKQIIHQLDQLNNAKWLGLQTFMRVKFDFYFDHFIEIIQDIATC